MASGATQSMIDTANAKARTTQKASATAAADKPMGRATGAELGSAAPPGYTPFDQAYQGAVPDNQIWEGVMPLGQIGQVVPGKSSGAAVAALNAQLASQIAGLQANGVAAGKQVGSLYNGLANQLGQYIPQEDAAFNATIGQSGNLFHGLDRSIQNTYAGQGGGLEAEMARLGQQNRTGGEVAQLAGDENFLRGVGGILGSGALSSLQLLKQGAHNYNQDVTGMAKTEGANRKADIAQAILSEIAAARTKNAAAVANAKSKETKATIKNPTSVAELLREVGGQWGKKGIDAVNTYLHSKQAQQGGMYDITHQEKDSKGNLVDKGDFRSENASTMSRYLYGQLEQGLNNPRNQATAQQLSDLLSQMYFGKKTYAGS